MAESDRGENALLASLLRDAPENWRDELEVVELRTGAVLHEPFEQRDQVFFPVTAVASLHCVMEDGDTAEVAVVGREGVVGLSVFLADGITPNRGVVLCAGSAVRLRASSVKREILKNGRVAEVMLRFTQALIAQMAQRAGCNRHHSIDQQVCRWILMMLDRHSGDVIVVTHEQIAAALGVRRESVSTVAARLQRLGLIAYLRGRITVRDRSALEQLACECYRVVRGEYRRLLPA